MRRIIQLRPDIGAGSEAIGISASAKSGCSMPQTQTCMPPIELPMMARRWSMPSPSLTSRYCASECPLEEALERIRAYSDTGSEALMLVGSRRGRSDLEAVHQVTSLPLCVLNPPPEVRNDLDFLPTHGVRIVMLGNPAYAVAVQAIYNSLKHLQDGGSLEALPDRQASPDLLRAVNRTDEFRQHQQTYVPEAGKVPE